MFLWDTERPLKKKEKKKGRPLSCDTVASETWCCYRCVGAAGESFEVVEMINNECCNHCERKTSTYASEQVACHVCMTSQLGP